MDAHGSGCQNHILRRRPDGRWELVEHGEATHTNGPEMSAALDRLVLAVVEDVITCIAGKREWHKGHQAKTCPLVVERVLREVYT